jgi:hypothetical protein
MSHNKIAFFISLLNAIIAATIPALVAIKLYQRGAIPEKDVRLVKNVIDPLADLSKVITKGDTIRILADQTSITNLRIEKTSITNAGESPIQAQDFFSGFSVKLMAPWTFLTIDTDSSKIKVAWKTQSKNEWVMEPLLLNPGDTLDLTLYYTSENPVPKESLLGSASSWDVRIAGLRRINKTDVYSPDTYPYPIAEKNWLERVIDSFATYRSGTTSLLILCLFGVIAAAHVFLAQKVGIPILGLQAGVLATLVAVLVALGSAESISIFSVAAFSTNLHSQFARSETSYLIYFVNASPILLNLIILWSSVKALKNNREEPIPERQNDKRGGKRKT